MHTKIPEEPENRENQKKTSTKAILRFVAVGDILLATQPASCPGRSPATIFSRTNELFAGSDLVFGNLECTLNGNGDTIATEPRVVATNEHVRAISPAGFDIVTLANNHMFDCLHAGFANLRDTLDQIGVSHFGAGDDLQQATKPTIIERNGIRIAFIAGVDRRSGASHYASAEGFGVTPLDVDTMCSQISSLVSQVNHVIVSLHWGEERFLLPAPEQIAQAHKLADAGASMILGHHPHVIQGMETYNSVPIVYSMGNFVANDVHYTDGDVLGWSRLERTGCILLADIGENEISNVRQIATFDSDNGVQADTSSTGHRRIRRANKALARGVTPERYKRQHLWIKTIRPALGYLRWKRLKTLRLRQFRNAFKSLLAARKAK